MLPLIVSILAPFFGTIQLLPQLYKTYHTRSVEDLSMHTILCIFVTDILWLLHGVFIFDLSLIISSCISTIIIISLVFLYGISVE
jgi:MtN3 and saliva related transmembrane protein